MNRRSVLRVVGAAAVTATAGCIERIRNLQLSLPVAMNVVNETETIHDVVIEAFAAGERRQTYDESVTVQPGQTANLGHLDTEPQRLRVSLIDAGVTEEADVGEDTQRVDAVIRDDGLELELSTRGEQDE